MNGMGDQLSERMLDFVVAVVKIADSLPKTVAGRHIAEQFLSAGTSCGANYEEACGAESRSDFIHKMSVVLKELKETRYWLRLITRTEILASTITESTLHECGELCAIVGKSVSTARKKKQAINNQ
jgi:four helix bundle protein